MTVTDIMKELEALGTAQTRKTFATHGAPNECYGVKIGDLKKHLLKKVKGNQELCMALFATGNSDAQYLAGLGIMPHQMTKSDILLWLDQSCWSAIDESIVAGVAAESSYALELAREWLASLDPREQNVGWLTYGKYLSMSSDELLYEDEIRALLERLRKEIHTASNAIRYSMNQFIIYVGSYCPSLTALALEVAADISDVEVTLATKGCKLPNPAIKIQKLQDNHRLGVKRKRVIC